jgi:PAS domain S-box-containing protein
LQTPNQEHHIAVNATDLATSDRAGIICVLHVDDDTCMLEVSKEILMMEGNFEIDHALSVEEAFKKLETQDYDVVISDYEMPQKNGLEFLKELRQQKNEIPFILFTGKGREEVVVKALNLGADRCINKSGSPEAVYSELADAISKTVERKKSKQLLVESESKYRTVVEKSLQGILITLTSPLQLVFANDNMARILGYSTDELLSLSPEGITGLIFQQDRSVFFKRLQSRARGKQATASFAFRAVRKDGSIIWLEAFSNLIEYEGQSAVLGMFLDISERKKADQILKESEARYRSLYESSFDGVMLTKPDGSILSANPQACRMLGMTEDEIKEAGREGIVVKDEKLAAALKERKQIGHIRAELTFRRKDGTTFVGEISSSIFKDAEGITKMSMIIRDIKIQEAEKRYRALFDWAPLGILIIDPQTGKPVEFNEVAHEQLGYSREEFAKLRIYEYKVDETPNETKAIIEKVLREGKAEWETKHRTKNGEVRDVVIISRAIELSDRKLLQSIYRDVTEAKKIEAALMDSETKYRQLVELAQEGVWALDTNNCTVYVNPRMAELLGYAESEMIGKNIAAFLDKPDTDFAKQHLEDCKLGNKDQYELVFIRKDGARLDASVAASSIKDDEGSSIGTLALVADIAKRKKAETELKKSHDKMETMNEKLRVVGGLTRHDVRNKLSAITGYSYLLKKRHADQADIVEGLDKMMQSVEEIEKIFEFAKAYEQLGAEELAFVNVGKALNEAKALFSSPLPKIVNDCHGLSVLADSFLRQMFYNFIDNTRKYGKTVATIKVYYEKTDEENLRLIYEDDGVGIHFENKQRLFKEGFSTGGSTGFGLFLINKMMDVYGWEIQETGGSGKGARFVMTIPTTRKNGEINYRITQKDKVPSRQL